MPTCEVYDYTIHTDEGDVRQRILVNCDEVYIPTTYWHDGKRNYTFGSKIPGAMILAGTWDGSALQAEDLDGETIWFVSATTASEIDPEDKATYENIRRKVLSGA